MNLTNEQKRKILSDAPMGAEYYSEVGGGTYLMRSMAIAVSFVFAYRPDGWKQALDKLSDWSAIELDGLQKEVDAEYEAMAINDLERRLGESKAEIKRLHDAVNESKAKELCKARCDAFGHPFGWDTLPEEKKQGYRNMVKAGVGIDEKAAK